MCLITVIKLWRFIIKIMNDTMSLLLATTILALGGMGLYMYKSSDDNESSEEIQNGGDEYNEDSLFGWGSSNDDEEREVFEPKVKSRATATKTKRNRRSVGSKRRY